MARAKMRALEMPVEVVTTVQEFVVNVSFLTDEIPLKPIKKYDFVLIVVNPFGKNQKGKMIVGDEAIQVVIDAGHLPNCRKIKR